MKTLKKILILILSIGMITSCTKSEKRNMGYNPIKTIPGSPFKADFTGADIIYGIDTLSDLRCNPDSYIRIINEGKGYASQIGMFTSYFDLCCDYNGCYPEGYNEAYLVNLQGDTLFISICGEIVQGKAEDHPDCVISYSRDKFVILGGTGIFKGATGEGMTDDYRSSEDPYSYHNWEGYIHFKPELEEFGEYPNEL